MKWISIDEKLPEQGERVLVCTDGNFVGEAFLGCRNNWIRYPTMGYVEPTLGKVTHWMPMPEGVERNEG